MFAAVMITAFVIQAGLICWALDSIGRNGR